MLGTFIILAKFKLPVYLGTELVKNGPPRRIMLNFVVLLMEEILHHLGCIRPCK